MKRPGSRSLKHPMRTLLIFLIGWVLVVSPTAQESFDIIIRGGRVVDGSGNPWVVADIGIRGDRIARVGGLTDASAPLEISMPPVGW